MIYDGARDLSDASIDDPYSIEQLRDPRMNLSVVRPFVDKLYELNDVSMGMYLLCSGSVGFISHLHFKRWMMLFRRIMML